MIEHSAGFPDNILAFVYRGHVTRADYETVLVPVVARALETQKRLRVYCVVESDFSGLDAGAVWEDLKVGIGHLTRWERVAVVTDVDWIARSMRFFNFLMPCPMKAFPMAEAEQAREWIGAAAAN
ncbi:MAG TPA: STAS/SEC14 domain-containing protein [Rhodopila sp.]|jgi:hypothetical protein|nr:STAS/SEC14 domain-containing protein [Rhodopila sp.]